MTVVWNPIFGETPIDISGLKLSGITNRKELSVVEAENVRKVIVKYLAGSVTRRKAKFDLSWTLKLHREVFGNGPVKFGLTILISVHHGTMYPRNSTISVAT